MRNTVRNIPNSRKATNSEALIENIPFAGISIVVPAYNEEKAIAAVLSEINRVMDAKSMAFEIIVVDDASTDGTADIVSKLDFIRLASHTQNAGYGAALKTGIGIAMYDIICITDADGTYPNGLIPDFISLMVTNQYDMVVGARVGDNCCIPLQRRFPKWVLTKLSSYLAGIAIPDINSGLRLMKKDSIRRFFNILPDGFSFTTTITLAMITNNLPVHFEKINYHKREGKSKIRPIFDTLNFLQLIIRTILYFNPLKVFIPLSLSLVALAMGILFASMAFLDRVMDVTFGVVLMTSVIVLAIGMLADLIDKRLQ